MFKPDILTNRRKPRKRGSSLMSRRIYVRKRLKELGLDAIELARSEAQHLPHVLHDDEEIGGAVSGRSKVGHILMVATNKRLIVLDCKPFMKEIEDIGYQVISGLSSGHIGPFHSLSVHTRLGDFKLKTMYGKALAFFTSYMEDRCIEHSAEGVL